MKTKYILLLISLLLLYPDSLALAVKEANPKKFTSFTNKNSARSATTKKKEVKEKKQPSSTQQNKIKSKTTPETEKHSLKESSSSPQTQDNQIKEHTKPNSNKASASAQNPTPKNKNNKGETSANDTTPSRENSPEKKKMSKAAVRKNYKKLSDADKEALVKYLIDSLQNLSDKDIAKIKDKGLKRGLKQWVFKEAGDWLSLKKSE